VPRNSLLAPTQNRTDLRLQQRIPLHGRASIDAIAEVFNIFNFANYADPSGGLSCAGAFGACTAFGVSSSTVGNQLGGLLGFGGPRQVQLSARFNF